ncbi:MAG: DUF3592 domain-containing protein [Planctomycetota bacterium]
MGSITRQQAVKEKTGKIVGLIFFAIFAIVGAVLLYVFGIRPIIKVITAQNWPQAPCKIVSAEVSSHEGGDSITYSIDIVYQYEFDGKTYESDRYDFTGGSSSGYESKAKVVRQYKKAQNPVCFVNPENPSEAVLHKGLHYGFFWALFPLPFVAIGIGGLIWVIKNWSKDKSTAVNWLPKPKTKRMTRVIPVSNTPAGAVVIKSKSPWAGLVFSIAAAAFWNGIVSVFIFDIIKEWQNGTGNLFKTLFFVPFMIIGAGLIWLVFLCLLALFNPRPTLTLSSAVIPLGGTVLLKWNFSGRTSLIRYLEIFLKGIETARNREKEKYPDENTFFKMGIYSTQNKREIPSGEVGFAIPSNSMHSFEAENNKVIWEVEVHGVIDSRPDVKENFKLTVAPAQIE